MPFGKSTSNEVGSWGKYARAAREHIRFNDQPKIAALHRLHDVLGYLTLQHPFQHQVSRMQGKGDPYDAEDKATFRSQDFSG